MSPDAAAIVRAFTEAFVARRLADMPPLLAHDCRDGNPDPHQPPGALGVLWKLALFQAFHDGFETRVGAIGGEGDRVTAEWTTRFPDGRLTRWRGRFTVLHARIQAFEVEHVDAG